MSKHTPGPWDIIDQYIIAGDESVICQWESYTKKADARLIAAAPTMHDYITKRAAAGDSEAAQILGGINGNT